MSGPILGRSCLGEECPFPSSGSCRVSGRSISTQDLTCAILDLNRYPGQKGNRDFDVKGYPGQEFNRDFDVKGSTSESTAKNSISTKLPPCRLSQSCSIHSLSILGSRRRTSSKTALA